MPNTTTATWPSLTAGTPARASDVEAKFDWSEYHLWPHSGGNFTDNTYDIGNTATAHWRAGYFYSLNATSTARGLAIGTTTVYNNSSCAFEISGSRGMLIPRLSTTQRDALSATNGMMIFNTTASQAQIYAGGWSAMGGGPAIGLMPRVRTVIGSVVTTTVVDTGTGVSGRVAWIMHNSTASPDQSLFTLYMDSVTTGELSGFGTTGTMFLAIESNPSTTGVAAFTTASTKFDQYFRDQLKVYTDTNGASTTHTTLLIYERSS